MKKSYQGSGVDSNRCTGFLEAWNEDYEKRRKIRVEKFWDEFFEKHFGVKK